MRPVLRTTILFLCVSVIFSACKSGEPFAEELQKPVEVTSFPFPGVDYEETTISLDVMLHVMPDGSVQAASIVRGALKDQDWNKSVVDSLLTWKFSKAVNGNPDGQLHRRTIKVQVEDNFYLSAIRFHADSREIADSLHALIHPMRTFAEVRTHFEPYLGNSFALRPPSELPDSHPPQKFDVMILRNHDIARYPSAIRRELRGLNYNRVSSPMELDGRYLLFFRFESEVPAASI